jgi:hypothetical protein
MKNIGKGYTGRNIYNLTAKQPLRLLIYFPDKCYISWGLQTISVETGRTLYIPTHVGARAQGHGWN